MPTKGDSQNISKNPSCTPREKAMFFTSDAMNILIVEDSKSMRRMIRSLVAPFATEVFECADGDVALKAYREHQPDWVLMDIRLKQTDGIVATREICAADPEARVVILTSYDDLNLRVAAQEAGACAYFLKDDLYTLPAFLTEYTEEMEKGDFYGKEDKET